MNLLERYGQVVPSKVNPDLPCVITPFQELTKRLEEVRSLLGPNQVAFIGAYSEKPRIGAEAVVWFREVVVGPGADQFAIPVLAGTRNNNEHDLMQCLRDYDARFGIDIRMAEYNCLSFDLKTLPHDLPGLVDELYALSPDPVDIGWTQAKELWVDQIAGCPSVFLWWQGV